MSALLSFLTFLRVSLVLLIVTPPLLLCGILVGLAYCLMTPSLWLMSLDSELKKVLPKKWK